MEGRTRLVSALRLAYAREGFLEAAPGAPRQEFDAATGVLNVTIPVEEGAPARVVALDLPDTHVRPTRAPLRIFSWPSANRSASARTSKTAGRLVSWYREQGFTAARVAGVLAPAKLDSSSASASIPVRARE